MRKRPILVIDDDPRSCETAATLLADAGFEVLSAPDGPTGIETARAAQPAVILLDMMMPGLDGIETCERLKKDPVPGEYSRGRHHRITGLDVRRESLFRGG